MKKKLEFGNQADIDLANQNTPYYKEKKIFYEVELFNGCYYATTIRPEAFSELIRQELERDDKVCFTVRELKMTEYEYANLEVE